MNRHLPERGRSPLKTRRPTSFVRSSRSWALALAVAGLWGCGASPAPRWRFEALADSDETLTAVAAHDSTTPTSRTWAERGWWRYLTGDRASAARAFAKAPDDPLAALGRARLADDALDPKVRLEAALEALAAPGWGAVLARLWAEEAATQVPDGSTRLEQTVAATLPSRIALGEGRHTVRISFLPFLDLRRLEAHAPQVTEKKRVRALGKSWALSAKAPKPDRDGLVVTLWPLEPGPAHIELDVDGVLLAWRGGRLVCAPPTTRFGARTTRFTAPGVGPLVVVWAAHRHPKVWRWSQPPPAPMRMHAGPGPDLTPGTQRWRVQGRRALVERYLGVEVSLVDGDYATAESLLADAPQIAAFHHQRARLADLEPSVPERARRDAARLAWAGVEPLAATRSWYERGRIALESGELEEARRQFLRAAEQAPRSHAVQRGLFRVYFSLGWNEEAAAALERAWASAPSPCDLVDDREALLASRGDVVGRARLVERYLACDKPLKASELLLELHRPAEALARLEALSAAKPDDGAVSRNLTRALLALGRLADAQKIHAKARQKSASAALAHADLAHARGELSSPQLEARLSAVVRAFPTDRIALELARAYPAWSLFAPLAIDSEQVIEDYEDWIPLPGPAIRVLEHTATLFLANGKSLRLGHEILSIRSRDAAEVYGELEVPEGAYLLKLYTRKQDGRRLYTEEVPEKPTFTMPDLEDGDYVIARYLETGDNGYLYNRGLLSRRVYFRGVDLPVFHQRFEAYSPKKKPLEHHRLGGAPEPVEVRLGKRAGLRFDVHQVPLLPPETDSVPPEFWLPSVRVGRKIKLNEDLDYVRDRVLAVRRRTQRFDGWVDERAGDGSPWIRAARLARVVRESVSDESGEIDGDAARMVQTGRGSRALVLSTALEAAGIAHRLILVRSREHVPAGPFLQVADFPYPLVHLEPPSQGASSSPPDAAVADWDGLWIDPSPDRAPPGFLPFPFVGGDALVLWPLEEGRDPIPMPQTRAVEDARHIEMTLHWSADGVLRGEVVDRLVGQESIAVGSFLTRLEPKERPKIIERLLIGVVGAARVTRFDDPSHPNQDQDPDGPLVLRYAFEASAEGALELGMFPASPGRMYAGESVRQTPLAIDLPTDQSVHVSFTSDRPLRIKGRAGALEWDAHAFSLRVDADTDAARLISRLQIAGGRVEPDGYPGFARWAREVDAAERIRIEVVDDSRGTL